MYSLVRDPLQRLGFCRVPRLMVAILVPALLTACERMLTDPSAAETPSALPASITILPAAAGIPPGGLVEFVAELRDEEGRLTTGVVEWETSNGSIDDHGRYTAPVEPGAYDVVAVEVVSRITASAAVRIDPYPATWIYPGQDIQEAVDSHPAGTEFLIKTGAHRLQRIRPKDGNVFTGEPGAVLSGAKLLSTFTREGSHWVADGQTQESRSHGPCDVGFYQPPGGAQYTGCSFNEDLFFDDVALFQVSTLAEVRPGRWFFDYASNRIYFADNPSGHIVEASVLPRAFDPSADNVTIRNLAVEKYASEAQSGAIHGSDTHGWLIENCDVRLNHGAGIRLGHGMSIVNSLIQRNGQIGLVGIGDNIVVESNEIAWNNTLHFARGWEAGGAKFVHTRNLVVRGNLVHHNDGPGLWTDIDNIDTLYEYNEVVDNTQAGIFHEVSYAAVIRNNVVMRNGTPGRWLYDAGILIAHSSNVEVHGNRVVGNANGICGIQQGRGNGAFGPRVLENLWVHDNVVDMTIGLTGLGQDVGSNAIYTSRNNRFDFNEYTLGTNAKYFHFNDRMCTEDEWRGFMQDTRGQFTR